MRRTINRVRRDLKRGFRKAVKNVKRNIRNKLRKNLEKALRVKEVGACYNLAKDIGALLG